MLKNKPDMPRYLWNIALMSTIVLTAIIAIATFSVLWKMHHTVYNITADFNPASREVEIRRVYRDQHSEIIGTSTESTIQDNNPLLDPMYAGYAPMATGYDPVGIYESGDEFGFFEYNRGKRYGEGGKFSRDGKTGIMTVEFDNGVTSWVGPDGVIASAWIKFGYDFSVFEPYVVFYER